MADYSTDFTGTENPLSESGVWVNNSPSGQFTKFLTTGGQAIAQCPNPNGDGSHYRDSYAFCEDGPRSPNAWVRTLVHMGTVTGYMEVEHLHRADEVDHGSGQFSPRCYEVMYNPNIGGTGYLDCARWSGDALSGPADIGYFEVIGQITSGLPTPFDGIEFYTEMRGNLIACYIDNTLVHTFDVSDFSGAVYEDGYTGIGADAGASGAESANSTWCFDNFQTGDVSMSISVVQAAVKRVTSDGGGTTDVLTSASAANWAALPTPGNTLLLVSSNYFGTADLQSVSDSDTNTFAGDAEEVNDLTQARIDRASAIARTSNPYVDTFQFNTSGFYDVLGGIEVAGLDAAPLVGQGVDSGDAVTGLTPTTTETDIAGEFIEVSVISYLTESADVEAIAPAGWTRFLSEPDYAGMLGAAAYRIVSGASAGARSCAWELQTTSDHAPFETAEAAAAITVYKVAGGGAEAVASDTNTPTDSAVSITARLSVGVDTNTPSDSAVSITQRLSVGTDTNTPTDSALGVSTRTIVAADTNTPTDSAAAAVGFPVVASDTSTPSDSAVSVTQRLSVAVDTNTPTDSALGVSTRTIVAADTNTPTDSAVSITARLSVGTDTNTPTDSAISSLVPSGVAVASDTNTPTDSAVGISVRSAMAEDFNVPHDHAICIGPHDDTIATYKQGTAFDAQGRMVTEYIEADAALPSGVKWLDGLAHTQDGKRLVTSWPGTSVLRYIDGFAVRRGGVQVITTTRPVRGAISGIPVAQYGQMPVSTDVPVRAVDGLGITADKRVSVTRTN